MACRKTTPPPPMRQVSTQAVLRALNTRLEEHGCRFRIVAARRVGDLHHEIGVHLRAASYASAFFTDQFDRFEFSLMTRDPEMQSVLIIAASQPHVCLHFTYQGRARPVVIPPTYATRVDERVTATLRDVLQPAGYRFTRAVLPVKLLAVRSGLAQYGVNNIAYVDGIGSYCRLLAFGTDMPCPDHGWNEVQVMDQCRSCQVCRTRCPTGAIASERFLIHADRCLTYLNEREADFPDWADPGWHHCVVGCLHCQTECPVNRLVPLNVANGAAFSEGETGQLLHARVPDDLPLSMQHELREYGFLEMLPELARNLRVLLESPGRSEEAVRRIRRRHAGR